MEASADWSAALSRLHALAADGGATASFEACGAMLVRLVAGLSWEALAAAAAAASPPAAERLSLPQFAELAEHVLLASARRDAAGAAGAILESALPPLALGGVSAHAGACSPGGAAAAAASSFAAPAVLALPSSKLVDFVVMRRTADGGVTSCAGSLRSPSGASFGVLGAPLRTGATVASPSLTAQVDATQRAAPRGAAAAAAAAAVARREIRQLKERVNKLLELNAGMRSHIARAERAKVVESAAQQGNTEQHSAMLRREYESSLRRLQVENAKLRAHAKGRGAPSSVIDKSASAAWAASELGGRRAEQAEKDALRSEILMLKSKLLMMES